MTIEKNDIQIMTCVNESVSNTITEDELREQRPISTTSSTKTATSLSEKDDVLATTDDVACTKTDLTQAHEHHLQGDDPEFGVNKPSLNINDDLTDGGYGWLVILGTFMVQVTSFGTAACWGIMQDHYDQTMFRDTVPNSQFQLSFVGTILEICVNLMGPIAQIIASRFGATSVLLLGTFLSTLGMELAGFSTQIWHLYLTQGVLFGSGASFLYVTAMSIAPLWFNKRRGLALGLASGGSGMGGLVLPFVITPLNKNLGAAWTYRILGFICLGCNLIACVVIKEKTSSKKKKGERSLKNIFRLDVLQDKNFLLWSLASVIGLMGYFIPYFFLPAYATHLGLTATQGSTLIAVMSAANFTGRILVGFIGDRIGRLNANIIFTFGSSFSSLFVWTFATSFGVLVAYAVLFGLCCGAYFAMMTPITAAILRPEQYSTGVSTLLLFNIISIFGISIASAIETASSSEPYLTYKMFTGVVYLISAILLVWLKVQMTKGFLTRI
ncbi:major facilitator superfamily domain-containing protein [Pilaira anomala]|nr:major facilitator superfamily domain-containing protein [Pilaira anomala]KAI9354646.1 major facilitator superfamily domain-containing protein [Pilaira anomala]